MGLKLPILLLAAASFSATAHAEARSETKVMDFEVCKMFTEKSVRDLGVPYDAVVRTGILWVTKIPVSDGAVLITCSKPDRKMVLTQSTY